MQQAFEAFVEWYAAYGYSVLFLGVLLENAGIPVPGETAVLVASFLASPIGGARFSLGLVIALTLAAAVLGDNIGFWLGRRLARPRLQRGQRFLVLTPKAFRTAEGYFARYGTLTVLVARFVTGLRVVVALAAGTAGMPWSRFFTRQCGRGIRLGDHHQLAGILLWSELEAAAPLAGLGILALSGMCYRRRAYAASVDSSPIAAGFNRSFGRSMSARENSSRRPAHREVAASLG